MADMADPADNTADPAHIMAHTADITADILARYRREAHTADILVRYRREADTSSAEADRHSAAAANGAAANGVAANGVAATGAEVTGAEVTDSSSSVDLVTRTTGIGTPLGAGAFLTRLTTAIILLGIILRMGTGLITRTTGIGTPRGAGAFLTRLTTAIILLGIILRIGTIMIAIATPLTATPIDLRLPSCSAGWLERATTMAPLMESWGRKLVVRFAPMNGRTWH